MSDASLHAPLHTSKRWRFARAYLTAVTVLGSYLLHRYRVRLFGGGQDEERVAALHRRNAERVEKTVLRLRGLFIKVGQLISIMTNFLPEEFRKPLERLQDQMPARPFAEIAERVRAELGGELTDHFRSFAETPIASASLGQVHAAVLHDGTEVAVKVQHSDIDDIVAIDLRAIWKIMLLINRFVPIQGLALMYRQLRDMVLAELDFVREAKSMTQIGTNLAALSGVFAPTVYPAFSTQRVLTISLERGAKISDTQQLAAWGVDQNQLADNLVRAYCHMIFADGFYHADPHPGNLLVRPNGDLVLLDFGAVAGLSPSMKAGIPKFLQAVLRQDARGIHRELRGMGFIARGDEAEEAAERIIEVLQQKLQEEIRIDSLNLKDIRFDAQKGMENLLDLKRQNIGIREMMHAFQVPKDWILLERTLLLVGGVCTHLNPNMSPMGTIRPYLEAYVLGEGNDLTSLVMESLRETGLNALSVPGDLRRLIKRTLRNEVSIRVEGRAAMVHVMYGGMQQLLWGGITLVLAWRSLDDMANPSLPPWVVTALWTASGISLTLLVASLVRTRRHVRAK